MSASSLLDLDTPCLKLNILAFFSFFFFFHLKKSQIGRAKFRVHVGMEMGKEAT